MRSPCQQLIPLKRQKGKIECAYLLSRPRLSSISNIVLPYTNKRTLVEIANCYASLAAGVELAFSLVFFYPLFAVSSVEATHTNICIAVIIRLQFRHNWYRLIVVVSGFGLLACARRGVVVGVWGGAFLCEGLFVGAAASGAAAFCKACHCVLVGMGWDV